VKTHDPLGCSWTPWCRGHCWPLAPQTVVLSQSERRIMKILKLHNKNQGVWEVILVTFPKKKSIRHGFGSEKLSSTRGDKPAPTPIFLLLADITA
jgi:hypothetical protein